MNMARNHRRAAQGGYSLVELLLTTALLLLFVGLGIVSMRTMSQGSALSEGTIRFETVLRFARAEAARSGHRVRVTFVQDTNQVATATNQLSHVELTWEPDPTGQPDVFQEMLSTQWGVDQVNETVAVESVKMADPTTDSLGITNQTEQVDIFSTNQVAVSDQENSDPLAGEVDPLAQADIGEKPSWITFNPDGSCDSAEVTLTSRNAEDDRRVVVKIEGFTGTVSRKDVPIQEMAESDTLTNQPSSNLPL